MYSFLWFSKFIPEVKQMEKIATHEPNGEKKKKLSLRASVKLIFQMVPKKTQIILIPFLHLKQMTLKESIDCHKPIFLLYKPTE